MVWLFGPEIMHILLFFTAMDSFLAQNGPNNACHGNNSYLPSFSTTQFTASYSNTKRSLFPSWSYYYNTIFSKGKIIFTKETKSISHFLMTLNTFIFTKRSIQFVCPIWVNGFDTFLGRKKSNFIPN